MDPKEDRATVFGPFLLRSEKRKSLFIDVAVVLENVFSLIRKRKNALQNVMTAFKRSAEADNTNFHHFLPLSQTKKGDSRGSNK